MKHGNFSFESLEFPDLRVITTQAFEDHRGSFQETYNKASFVAAGIEDEFVQDNQSFSRKGTLRGFHIQRNHPQAKLVRVVYGSVIDFVVDLREESPTNGQVFFMKLKADGTMLYIPEGFAHAFLATEDAVFSYKCSRLYQPNDDVTLHYRSFDVPWDDIAKAHGIDEFVMSKKDRFASLNIF